MRSGSDYARSMPDCHNQRMSPVADRLETAREAAEQRRWAEAYELLSAADRDGELGPDDLERLAQAAMWSHDPRAMAPYYERAYAAHVAAGNKARAGYVAVTLAHYFGGVRLQRSIGNGWRR